MQSDSALARVHEEPAPTNPHQWTFYLSPHDTWDAMYDDCQKATRSIHMEQYIFENDAVGQKFMRLFIECAKAGKDVRILCDEVGSRSLCSSPLVNELKQAGGRIAFYNSLKLIDVIKPKRLFPRTHMKALVVDESLAYIGGACIAERMAKWRDTQIRVTGPVVGYLAHALARNFNAEKPERVPRVFPAGDFFYVQSEPGFFRHPIYRAMLEAIRHARHEILISEAYFIPPRRLRRYLKQAAQRGVKVSLLIPERSDFWLVDWVCLSYTGRLLKHGVKIFRYKPSVLHTKTMVVDAGWALVGSSNMDPLSFFHNREGDLVVKNADVIRRMKDDFQNDLKVSDELTRQTLDGIPLWKRMVAHLARLIRFFL